MWLADGTCPFSGRSVVCMTTLVNKLKTLDHYYYFTITYYDYYYYYVLLLLSLLTPSPSDTFICSAPAVSGALNYFGKEMVMHPSTKYARILFWTALPLVSTQFQLVWRVLSFGRSSKTQSWCKIFQTVLFSLYFQSHGKSSVITIGTFPQNKSLLAPFQSGFKALYSTEG